LSEVRVKPLRKLPEPLPDGEQVLWQRSPAWRPYSRRVFQVGKLGLYFAVLIGWVAASAYANTGDLQAALGSLVWTGPPAIGVLMLLAFIAWGYARTTVYTITNKRVIIQSGLAVPAAVNLPFSQVSSADLKTYRDGTGDIEVSMSGQRLLYSMLWPNVRLFRLKRPVPVLRGLHRPREVAQILGQALAADQAPEAESAPAPERRGTQARERRPATA